MKQDRVEIRHFGGPLELARAAAAEWVAELGAAARDRDPYCVALPGGRITGAFFDASVELLRGRGELLPRVHLFWGDERCVPPEDPRSNFRLARERLLKPLGIAAANIHRIRGEILPEHAAMEAERDLARTAKAEAGGQPVLDLVVLGMGEDGHVASLFPGEPESVRESRAVYRAVVGPKPPPRRITLGYAPLGVARKVWVLASGEGKEEALISALEGRTATPLARLLELRAGTTVFTDIIAKRS
jgi:6-phosphogluconolactonase